MTVGEFVLWMVAGVTALLAATFTVVAAFALADHRRQDPNPDPLDGHWADVEALFRD